MAGIDKKIYDVYSKKHDVRGQIIDYGVVIKLQFAYAGIEREIAIKRPFPENGQEAFSKLGEDTIDSFIEKLSGGENRKLMIHYWYVDENTDDATGEKFMCAHGIVTGHGRIADTHRIHTSEVFAIEIDRFAGEALIRTRNSLYHCPFNASLAYSRGDSSTSRYRYTISFGSSKITEELHPLQQITRMEFSPVLTIMESVVGSYMPNWKLRLLFMGVSLPQIFCTI